MGIANTTVVT